MSRTLLKGLGLLVGLLALAIMWSWLQQTGLLTQAHLAELADLVSQWQTEPWMFAAVIAVYTGTQLIMFPLSLLVVVTGLLFGPAWGLAYATLGTLSSSVVSYWVGHWLGREALMRWGAKR